SSLREAEPMAAPIGNWQADLLRMIGAPVTAHNLRFFNAWQRAETSNATNNPFNTTLAYGGSTPFNPIGVQNYANPRLGLIATARTLEESQYRDLLASLRASQGAVESARRLKASPWVTGDLVLRILGAP